MIRVTPPHVPPHQAAFFPPSTKPGSAPGSLAARTPSVPTTAEPSAQETGETEPADAFAPDEAYSAVAAMMQIAMTTSGGLSPSALDGPGNDPGPPCPYVSERVPSRHVELRDDDRARLEAMGPERSAMFEALRARFDGQAVRFPSPLLQANVVESLDALLERGRLDVKSARGHDLLAELHDMSRQDMAVGLDRDTVMAQAIVEATHPGATICQGNRGTCAATTVQYLLARKNPAEFVRVAAGLTRPAGEVALAGGLTARRIDDSVAEDHSGRTALDRIVQSSFMEAAAGDKGFGHYSNERNGFVLPAPHPPPGPVGWNLYGGPVASQDGPWPWGEQVHCGLLPEHTQRLAEAALGQPYQEIYQEGAGDRQAALRTMEEALRGGSDPLPVSMQWGTYRHRVAVTEIRDGRVHFRNPWGEPPPEARRDGLLCPDHKVGEGGIESMSENEFAEQMRSVIVPQAITPQTTVPKECMSGRADP